MDFYQAKLTVTHDEMELKDYSIIQSPNFPHYINKNL